MSALGDNTINLLYDHYKQSFDQIQRYTTVRNRLFVYVLLGAAAMQLLNPAEAQSVLAQVLAKYVGVAPQLTMQSVATILWIAVLYGMIRYYQATLTIDLQYQSLHELEDKLSTVLGAPEFRRERRGYEHDFRGFRWTVSRFYRVLVPLAFVLCLLSRLVTEYSYADGMSLGLALDSFLFGCATLVAILYMYESNR